MGNSRGTVTDRQAHGGILGKEFPDPPAESHYLRRYRMNENGTSFFSSAS